MPFGLIAVRALHFWSVSILFGGGEFNALVGIGRIPRGSFALRLAAYTAAFTGMVWFALTFVSVTGSAHALFDPQEWSAFAESPFGPPWIAQIVLDFITLALAAFDRVPAFVMLGALLAFDQAWLGHAATGTSIIGVTMIASYTIHVLAGFGWIGALTMLCLGLRSPEMWRDGLRLFSTAGLFTVVVIFASGCLNGAFHMNERSDLLSSPYGRLVLCKVMLFAFMLALAAFNRREGRHNTMTTRRFALGVGVETLLGVLILCVAAVLGVTPPAS